MSPILLAGRTLLLLLLFALPVAAQAQATFGLKAGLNVSDLYGFEEGDLDGGDKSPILGFTGGMMAQLPLSASFAVRPEVLYSMKGTKISGERSIVGVTTEVNQTSRIHYVEVPLLARVGLPVGPFSDAGLMVGPALAFRLSETTNTEINGEPVDPDLDDFDNFTKSFDTGIVLGAEYGSGPFAVEGRYTYGLLNVNKFAEGEDEGENGPSLRNGVFSITGMYRFGS